MYKTFEVMRQYIKYEQSDDAIDIIAVRSGEEFAQWLKQQPDYVKNWVNYQNFKANVGDICQIFDSKGRLHQVLVGCTETNNLWHWAALASKLPANYLYTVKAAGNSVDIEETQLAMGWLLASYNFNQYKTDENSHSKFPTLLLEKSASIETSISIVESIILARDLINQPANHFSTRELATNCKQIAQHYNATYKEIIGKNLLKQNYPAIYAVGQASDNPPILIDITWGNEKNPTVAIIGKGVCFDTGGLNIKTGNSMGLMKKDMGGAACALALARLVMLHDLPVRMRLLIPAVENSVSGNSMRPQDIIRMKNGITVEIGNTDAEGRLILADALVEADSENPDMIIDMATLTGASRVALGPDIPSFFTENNELAQQIAIIAEQEHDPLWRLPLWQEYMHYLDSDIADVNNCSSGSYAGAITAALFLKKFVNNSKDWIHIDMMAWNLRNRAGRPVGGEANAIRTLFHYLQKRYKSKP